MSSKQSISTTYTLLHTAILFFCIICFSSSCDKKSLCEGVDCGENGQCAIDTSGQTICSCNPGYEGELCETYNPCLLLDCINGGNCLVDEDQVAYCDCPPEYIGVYCETINPCFEYEACQNGGSCVVVNNLATCECPPEYIGLNCELDNPCFGIDCPSNSNCNTDNGNCECDPGYAAGMELCDQLIQDLFVGEYLIQQSCGTECESESFTSLYEGTSTITADPEDLTKVLISNFGGFGTSISADITPNQLIIQPQDNSAGIELLQPALGIFSNSTTIEINTYEYKSPVDTLSVITAELDTLQCSRNFDCLLILQKQ